MASLRGVIILCVLHLCVQSIEGEVKPAIPDDKFLIQRQQKTETKDTVWMGFMDIVPVIGTVKESVELVLALYEGNEAVIKEKQKAVENFVKESFKKHVEKSTLPDKPAEAAEFSGLRNVREVGKERIIEHVMKRSKRGKEKKKALTEAEKIERQRELRTIQDKMLEKIHHVNQNFRLNQDLVEQKGGSNRGEHVFNNDILKFHSDLLNQFLDEKHIKTLPGYNQQAMDKLDSHTLSQNTAAEIQDNMVVHFDKDEFYVNANGVMYGEYIRVLRGAMLAVLNHIDPDEVTEEQRQQDRQRVNDVIDNMNNFQIYVDELAKDKWIKEGKPKEKRQDQFDRVKQEVVNMYKTVRGVDWCDNILGVVRPLLGY